MNSRVVVTRHSVPSSFRLVARVFSSHAIWYALHVQGGLHPQDKMFASVSEGNSSSISKGGNLPRSFWIKTLALACWCGCGTAAALDALVLSPHSLFLFVWLWLVLCITNLALPIVLFWEYEWIFTRPRSQSKEEEDPKTIWIASRPLVRLDDAPGELTLWQKTLVCVWSVWMNVGCLTQLVKMEWYSYSLFATFGVCSLLYAVVAIMFVCRDRYWKHGSFWKWDKGPLHLGASTSLLGVLVGTCSVRRIDATLICTQNYRIVWKQPLDVFLEFGVASTHLFCVRTKPFVVPLSCLKSSQDVTWRVEWKATCLPAYASTVWNVLVQVE